jgi:hypothetical protein
MQSQADRAWDKSIAAMRSAMERLAAAVPAPVLTRTASGPHYRYREQDVRQAIVLKSVRAYSAALAMRTLIDAGLALDAGAVMRIADELGSDILFLAGPLIFGKEPEENHRRFIQEFFQEEFDTANPLHSTQSRDRVPAERYGRTWRGPIAAPCRKARL